MNDLYEIPVHEIPTEGTVALIHPMHDPIIYVAPAVTAEIVDDSSVSYPIPYIAPPMGETVIHEVPVALATGSLLNREESEVLRARWNEIQGQFVDEPRTAVQQADILVSEVIQQITKRFADNHTALESQWNQGNDVSTEDLRMALQHYRSFFNRMVV